MLPVYVFDASIVENNDVGAKGLSDHSFRRMALCDNVSIELVKKEGVSRQVSMVANA